jgi:acyl-CoA synthetase (AMP-forming)/AMP-acid ligase II
MSRTETLTKALFTSIDPDATAIIDTESAGTSLSYRALQAAVDDAGRQLVEIGLKPGDAVVFASRNSAALLVSLLSVMSCGGVAVPVNPELTAEEIAYCMEDSHAILLAVSESVKENLDIDRLEKRFGVMPFPIACIGKEGRFLFQELEKERIGSVTKLSDRTAPRYRDETCLMIYTSGTTSRPKGVPFTQQNLLASVDAFVNCFQLTKSDATLVPMPYFHVHGLIGATFSTLRTGGTAVLQPKFSASRFWHQVREHSVTWYTASPTIHRILLQRPQGEIPHGQLRFIRSSSANLDEETIKQMEEKFGTVVLQAYGMTEAANQVSCNPFPPRPRKPGSVGISQGVEITIALDEKGKFAGPNQRGEIVIRGKSVMSGYHNKPQVNAESFMNDWFRTGDEGYIDEDGYLFIVGRIKELINRGGEKISPAEVEAILQRHPCVEDAACFAVPDPKYGEEIHAAAVLKQDVETRDIIEFCAKYLSPIKLPKVLHITDKIPRNPTNKVQRQELTKRFSK